jgi:hypothetical protein
MVSARAILFSLVLTASTALAASTLAPAANALREKSIEAHGGVALEKMKTYREDFAMNATVLGVGVYNFRIKATVDYVGERGRLEFFNNGALESVVQLTKDGTVSWSKKNGLKNEKNARKPGEDFTFSMPFKSGVLGLLALGKLEEEKVTTSDNLEIEGVRGKAIVRTGKQYEVTYIFAPDGSIALERAKYQGEKADQKSEFSLIYNKYKVVGGVKIPVGAAIRSSQIPGIAAASLEVKDVDVNPVLTDADFKMPQ